MDISLIRFLLQFKLHKEETDPVKIQHLLQKAQENLGVVERQGAVQQAYRGVHDPSVMETKKRQTRLI